MSIETFRILIIGGAPPVKVYTAVGNDIIFIKGEGIIITKDATTPIISGYRLDSEGTRVTLANGNQIWARASSSGFVSILVQG
jgi:hypothetical protein